MCIDGQLNQLPQIQGLCSNPAMQQAGQYANKKPMEQHAQ
jgi:hypothetical protein